jgi:uncharacterized protein
MGEVIWIGRYPVKSMLGESPTEVRLGGHGIDGDRRYAVLDEATGLVGSAKNPRRWGWLLQRRASYGPDGALRVDDLGDRPGVRLVERTPGDLELERLTPETEPGAGEMTRNVLSGATFVDFGAVHIVTTATLEALGGIEAVRFRPNLVVRMDGGVPFEENGWAGRTIGIGAGVEIDVLLPTPRCVIPSLAHGALPADPRVTRTAAARNRVELPWGARLTCVGAYASVRTTGTLRVGDPVHIAAGHGVGAA